MKYNVSVNGKKFEVEVERADGVVAAPAPAAAAAPAVAGGVPVLAPMPGTIVDIKVSAGQQIQKGQVLVILEAMKMENEIVADRDGIVASVSASKGDNVNSNDLLLTLK